MLSRRNFLKGALACTLLYPFGDALAAENEERILNMLNTHTGETLEIKYFANGAYDQGAIDRLNYLLRCHYTNEVKPVDVRLLDLLCSIKDRIGRTKQIRVISGYRSPSYNCLLRSEGHRVARASFHMKARAIDFTIPGVTNHDLSRLAKSFAAGGVGVYSAFVHIDTGPQRIWG
jgi:uncharacterized protein YcbK (DUF882 family)